MPFLYVRVDDGGLQRREIEMKGKEDPHHLRSSLPEADAVIGVLVEVSRAVVESLQDSGLLIVRKTGEILSRI